MRTVIIMPHERRRLRQRVDYVTSPGHGDGAGWRQRVGLAGGGPAALITTLGVFGFDAQIGVATLLSYHPGVTLEEIQHETEWPLRVASDLSPTPPPTAEEIAIIRSYDPTGFWTGTRA
jgi:glutaconate CoA-transferase subunit B